MRRIFLGCLLGVVAALGAAVLLAGAAHAATITVTVGSDDFGNGDGECSLREAIQAANTNSVFDGCAGSNVSDLFGDDIIVFTPTLTTTAVYRSPNNGNNDNISGDLDVFVGSMSGTLTIRGPITIRVAGIYDRAIDVHPAGSGSSASFTLEDVTITGGDVRAWLQPDDVWQDTGSAQLLCVNGGGAVRVISGVQATLAGVVLRENAAGYAGGGLCAQENAGVVVTGSQVLSNVVGLNGNDQVDSVLGGGGIWSGGALVLTNTDVLTNRVELSGSLGGYAGGGGIGIITGSLRMVGGAVSDNQVTQHNSTAEANGGGILVARSAHAQVEQAAVANNRVLGGREAFGGGVAILQGTQAQLEGVQIVGNVLSTTQGARGGGLATDFGFANHVTLRNVGMVQNEATASAAVVAGVVSPTVFGGGAFFGTGAAFTVTAAVISGNQARYIGPTPSGGDWVGLGGGVSVIGAAAARIEETQILGNRLADFRFNGGGGLHVNGVALFMRDSAVGDNRATSSSFSGAGSKGGGVFVDGAGELHLEDGWVYGNEVTGTLYAPGGGLGVDGKLYITRTQVTTNTAPVGGGLSEGANGLVHARAITVTGNRADTDGGAWRGIGVAFVADSLFANNSISTTGQGRGGAIRRGGGEFHMLNSTVRDNVVRGNSQATAGGIFLYLDSDASTALVTAVVTNSRILSNVAESPAGNAYDAGVSVGASATLRLSDSQVAFNVTKGETQAGGGGIGVAGAAEVIRTTVRNNRVLSYTSNQPAGAGAGIIYGGSAVLTLTHSAVVSNSAEYASGVFAYGAPLANIVNSTVSGNGPSGSTTAQGIVLTGTAYLTHTTVASNTGIGLVSQGAASFHAVLVGYNTSGDCRNWGGYVLGQYASLSSDASCGAFGFTYTNTDPKLKPLALNGGSTPNHALQVGSPALSKVLGCVVSDDQRGAPRQTPYCDIGAFELIDYRVWAPIVRKP